MTTKSATGRSAFGLCTSLSAGIAILLLIAAAGYCAQDQFCYSYFCYRDENDTINEAFALRLDKQVLEKTKLKFSYLHSDTRYWKVPLWEPPTRYYSHGDQYSFNVEQKTFKDGKLTLGYVFTDRAMRLTDAYLIQEMEKKAKQDSDIGPLRKPRSSSFNVTYSQPFFDQNTTASR